MLYAATTLWLMVIVFSAWGVHRIWCALVPPKVVNMVLLPGTLVAAIGYVVGMLVSGGTVNNTALIRKDRTGAPQTDENAKPRIPVLGPILVAMMPMLGCAAAIYYATKFLGTPMLDRMSPHQIPNVLPLSVAGIWALLHDCLYIMEGLVGAVAASDFTQWPAWVFVYLTICLTIRMGPLPDSTRGAVGAIVVLGLLSALLGNTTDIGRRFIESGWPVLSFSVASLLFTLVVTLLIRGGVGFVRILINKR